MNIRRRTISGPSRSDSHPELYKAFNGRGKPTGLIPSTVPISGVEMSTDWVVRVSPRGAVGGLLKKTVKDESWREIELPVTNVARKQDWFDLRPYVNRMT
jgi:hypothetical protein